MYARTYAHRGDGFTERWAPEHIKPAPSLDVETIVDPYLNMMECLIETRSEDGYTLIGMTSEDLRIAAGTLLQAADAMDEYNR